jgi:hypothetical protein
MTRQEMNIPITNLTFGQTDIRVIRRGPEFLQSVMVINPLRYALDLTKLGGL